ncbi:cell division and transport-associated protein TolR [Stella humosa]|uniref:Cell division and transport-associated protein TolR n=1 Tax=Stella humosa TaxID=94 RepID=A0A3N1LDW8_9PROT|nr:protein TolR [Stella humosa]ROP91301.1 cell division and transport-associated protein TolR [Stella humosa]BBK34344.1 protein TolR [Stella humosa]
MAGAVLKRGGGRGGRRYVAMSEINVTPFVDVMLVLLIVFMVTAPLLTVGVPVDLPKASAPTISEQKEPITVSITAQGKIYLQEGETTLDNLVARLVAITENDRQARVFVRGDRNIVYGRVMEVMGALNAAGFARVALIAELPQAAPDEPVRRGRQR